MTFSMTLLPLFVLTAASVQDITLGLIIVVLKICYKIYK